MTSAAATRATGLHHVGVTVSDLDRSLEFYADVFDVHPELDLEIDPATVERATRVVGSTCRLAFVRLPDGVVIELLEYSKKGRDYALSNNDVGAAHPCFLVSDIDAAYARLQARGADCYHEPTEIPGGPLEGYRFFYFEDPDGLVVELLQPPVG